MKYRDFNEAVGRIVKGVNTTADVGPGEIKKQAAKFGFNVDKDGRPKQHTKKVKGSKTNVLFNLGLAEGYKLKLERDKEMLVLNITDTGTGKRTEVRGKPGYETDYDPSDKLHKLLDKVGKSANISDLMNGEVVGINPKHPDADRAKTATDQAYNENKVTECPRTRASNCQCESVNKISESEDTISAVCVLEHSDVVKGTILFKQQAQGPTMIVGKITGLEPGEHGFHVHEFGDLSKGCESAGGHYNPDGEDHGDLEQGHVGDLGNITANDSGVADIRIVAKRVSLIGERSIVGRAIVVHKDQDDLGQGGDEESLKTGNAGDRLACGVITLKETVKENINEEKEITVYTDPSYQGADIDDKYWNSKSSQQIDFDKLEPFEPADKMKGKKSADNMKKFVDKIKAGEKIKPIIVTPKDGKYLILDGHHRYFAARIAKLDSMEAVVVPGKHVTFTDEVPDESEQHKTVYHEKIKEDETELSQETEIFVDMDGVLADFFGAWKKLIGQDWRKIDDIEDALQKIRDKDGFWLSIPKTQNAMNLLGIVKKLKGKYNILSAPLANDPNSEPHKREWIEKNLKSFPPENIYITQNKSQYATQTDGTPNILIDDFGKNINSWEAAGGVGFKHKDHKFERTANKLAQYMQQPVEEDTELNEYVAPALRFGWASIKFLGRFIKRNPKTSLGTFSLPWTGPILVSILKGLAWLTQWGVPIALGVVAIYGGKKLYDALKDKDPDTITEEELEEILKNYVPNSDDDLKGLVTERTLTKGEEKEKERIVKGMKKKKGDFKDRYGKDADAVMYATATKMAKEALISGLYTTDQVLDLLENFADGKKSGKSRPGRVKKSGASCGGSVTELRKKAKNSSGERAKMYHWCANMKSGKKKGK